MIISLHIEEIEATLVPFRPGISNDEKTVIPNVVDLNIPQPIFQEVNGEKWLECKQVKQKGGAWISCEADQWMPFRYSQYYLQEA